MMPFESTFSYATVQIIADVSVAIVVEGHVARREKIRCGGLASVTGKCDIRVATAAGEGIDDVAGGHGCITKEK